MIPPVATLYDRHPRRMLNGNLDGHRMAAVVKDCTTPRQGLFSVRPSNVPGAKSGWYRRAMTTGPGKASRGILCGWTLDECDEEVNRIEWVSFESTS